MYPAQLYLFPIRVSRLAIYFSSLISIAWSAAINIPHVSLTTSSSANSNHCTDNHTWIGTGPTSTDCIGAAQSLYDSEVKSFSDFDFEFLSGAALRRSPPAMRTPRKYTHGTCTLAIVMLNFFSDGELPGGVRGPFASRDVTSFREIWQSALQIEAVCVLHSGKAGWAVEGGRGAIGIFLWATDSSENQRVPPGEPTFLSLTRLPGSKFDMGNGSHEFPSSHELGSRRYKMGDKTAVS